MIRRTARFSLREVVRHRHHSFRGVVFDVDPEFGNTEEWYAAIPEEARPVRDQPFYHLFAESEVTFYVAYVSEQNLILDPGGGPVAHPEIETLFGAFANGRYPLHSPLN